MITYRIENDLSVPEFTNVLVRSTLAERRPIDEPDRLAQMLRHANLTVTARHDGRLVGVARSLTDYSFCTYLSDLAVDVAFQKSGIGKELIRHTKLAAPQALLILLAAPAAVGYYPRIGMKHHQHCYYLEHVEQLA